MNGSGAASADRPDPARPAPYGVYFPRVPDSTVRDIARRWSILVFRSAKAVGRADNNVRRQYVTEKCVKLQLRALALPITEDLVELLARHESGTKLSSSDQENVKSWLAERDRPRRGRRARLPRAGRRDGLGLHYYREGRGI
jgi:hypothetical protein